MSLPTAPDSEGPASSNESGEPTQTPPSTPLVQPTEPALIRGQTSAHRGLRTFAQDRSRNRRER